MNQAISTDLLAVNCAEWRDVAGDFPQEMEVVVEMMIEAEEELCLPEAA